jgi:DNA polymerase-3 subunit gamma/tau
VSYLVLARKYRPQTFEEIVGQEHVTRTLANAFAKKRVHHAFLFCGARGVGKTTAARVLARALCCEKGPTPTPCGVCVPCVTIAEGTAVDYFEIDGASNTGVDSIRELRDGIRYQPAQLRKKIYVIDEVHMLSTAAFNALLKTLEEPPPHVTFIFATTEVHKIPVTILSRCQRFDFKLVAAARLLTHLHKILAAEKIEVEAGALRLLVREAGGSVRDALSLTDQVIAYSGGEGITEARVAEVLGVADQTLLHGLLAAVLRRDAAGLLTTFDAAIARGVDLAHLARAILGLLRDAAVVHAVADPEGLVDATAEEIQALRALVKDVPRPHVIQLFERFAKACEELQKALAPRLLLEVALIDMASAEPLVPIADLVDRLDQMTKGAPPRPAPRRAEPPAAPPPRAVAPPPPAPAPAPPRPRAVAAYRPPADTLVEWERLVGTLTPGLQARCLQAKLLGWSERAVELGFPPRSLGLDPEDVGSLRKALAAAGHPVEVKIQTVEAATPSLVDVEAERQRQSRQTREDEARKHPITEAVIQTFGASIKEIKVDG